MALRNILTEGNETLLKKSRPVVKFDARLHQLLDDMEETLQAANGVGLAAPQVGVLRRLFIVDDGDEMIECINPEILEESGEQEGTEGCLSVPGKWGVVTRPSHVKLRAQDRYGDWFEAEGEDLIARCFCHEYDHLDGRLYTELATHMLTEQELAELQEAEEEA